MRQQTFLLYGYYGSRNLGDDLLLTACIDGIRQFAPDARFFVRDHGYAPPAFKNDEAVTFTGIEMVWARPSARWVRAVQYLAAFWRLLGQVDWLVFGGGTVFHHRATLLPLLLQLMICMMARLRGVRIMALGVGVAEMPTAGRACIRVIVGLSTLFLVRDAAALRQCGGKAELAADLVFTLSPGLAASETGRKAIAFSIYPPAASVRNDIMAAVAATVRHCIDAGQDVIFLVFQQDGPAMGDDRLMRLALENEGLPADRIAWRYLEPDMGRLHSDFSDVAVLCGMRYHGLVLAAIFGLPFVGIAHDNKISSICDEYGMPSVSQDAVSTVALTQALAMALGRVPSPRQVAADAAAAGAIFQKAAILSRPS